MAKKSGGTSSETGNKFADGLLLPMFAVAAVFLFIILCFYAYNHVLKGKNNNELVVLDAEEGSFKEAPKDPGGMEVEHTDKEVFNTVTGNDENLGDGNVNVENQENVVSAEELANSTTPPNLSLVVTKQIAQREQKEIPGSVQQSISEDASAAAVEKSEKPAQPVPAMKTEIKQENDKTILEFKETPKSMGSKTIAKSGSGYYYVQVSSHTSKAEAEAAWAKIVSKYGAEIAGNKKNVMEAEVRGKRYYRLTFGPFKTKDAASTKCGILKAKGQDCLVQK